MALAVGVSITASAAAGLPFKRELTGMFRALGRPALIAATGNDVSAAPVQHLLAA
ncbi:hypothetical protein [Comamonas serinivorans]|uniref:hypothetical protein n=1 Tax=Comamonas serinivorans TaxID=1082851 RepID=UPI0012F7334D|nr:hypothetical protein [Comamonas serinivorans]